MLWLRRGWLCAIAGTMVITVASALLMRYDLLSPEPTLSPDLFTGAFSLHGAMAMGLLAGALIAIPTLLVTPVRGSAAAGFVALGVWVAALVLLWDHPRFAVRLLAASLGFGAAQLAVSLRQPRPIAAIAGLVAIAIIAIPLFAGELPTTILWIAATTVVAAGVIASKPERSPFALFTVAPCLVLAWVATALVHVVHTGYFQDTVAMVSPLPVTGGALLGVLLAAATHLRAPHRPAAHIAAALVTTGAGLTSLGFFVLGEQGMPRRYLAYDAQFQPLHVLVGVATIVTLAGCVAALEAFRRASAVPPVIGRGMQ